MALRIVIHEENMSTSPELTNSEPYTKLCLVSSMIQLSTKDQRSRKWVQSFFYYCSNCPLGVNTALHSKEGIPEVHLKSQGGTGLSLQQTPITLCYQ